MGYTRARNGSLNPSTSKNSLLPVLRRHEEGVFHPQSAPAASMNDNAGEEVAKRTWGHGFRFGTAEGSGKSESGATPSIWFRCALF